MELLPRLNPTMMSAFLTEKHACGKITPRHVAWLHDIEKEDARHQAAEDQDVGMTAVATAAAVKAAKSTAVMMVVAAVAVLKPAKV